MFRSISVLTALAFSALPMTAAGAVLRADINDDDDATSSTQSGWTALAPAGGTNLGGTGISIAIAPVGAGVLIDDRVRTTNGGGSEPDLWEDFIFANGSDLTTEGLDLTITGLLPSRTYPVKLWMFDKGSTTTRMSTWNGSSYTFAGSNPAPASLADAVLSINVTTDAAGSAVIQGRAVATGQAHNVFLNGLEIGDPLAPPTGPTDISLSHAAVGSQVALATLVGTFSTTDPEAGDNHTYTLVSGAGSTNNALFSLGGIDGEDLRAAASLAAYAGQTLSIRVRTTDQHGDFYEEVLSITVTDDSDSDGLSDTWELQYFPLLTTATGSGNNDGDTLTNLQEQTLGTNPTLTDTDADTLPDHLEDNSRVFNGLADPGCSPLLPDTDGDGIRDDAEISTADGFITNPNATDTDGDGFSDPAEISAGTNPVNAASFPDTLLPLRISEFMAGNSTGLKDGYGEASDWIEIQNPNPVAVNLDAWFLTDDAEVLNKWNFPAVSVPAGGYLVVFASTRNTTDPLGKVHTNFSLSGGGEYLALVKQDGSISSQYSPAFPEQKSDISYGYHPTDGTLRFFSTPTPGAANNAGFDGVVADTTFSVKRGFYDAPFSLAITTLTPGATIRYTTDGTKPTTTTGTIYTTPLNITGTTTVRALAYRTGWLSTNVDTHTYLFLDQVVAQSTTPSYPPGLPATWGVDSQVDANDGAGTGIVPADYAMDQRVVTGAQPGYSVREALLAIPTINLSLPVSAVFNNSTGIWSNPLQRGTAWEKECSVEMIVPDGAAGQTAFQEDCIVETHGNSSRNPWRMQKHSLRLTFRNAVGPGSLDYNLFPESSVRSFNKLVLRACFTDSWGLVSWDAGRYRPNDSQYLRDFYMKEIYRKMGQPSSYGAYSHVYINGLYMGLFNHSERLEDDFFVNHFGGVSTDWEVFADFTGAGPRWNAMMALTDYNQIAAAVDLENFADYVLLHAFSEAEDWPHHNGYAASNPAIGFPWRFFVWDQEIGFDNHTINRLDGNISAETQGVGALIQKMRTYPEFRLLFADRVRKHLFNGGALTAANAGAEYLRVAGLIDQAIVAESARWGDTRSSLPYGTTITQPSPLTAVDHLAYPPAPNTPIYFTRHQSWVVERDNIVNNHIPSLHNQANTYATVRVLRALGNSTLTTGTEGPLYPSTNANAPDFSRHGGVVAPGFSLAITSTSSGGTIYYTLNGADPREAFTGNALGTVYSGPVALSQTGTVKARYRSAPTAVPPSEWSALTEALFIVGTPAAAGNLVITKIHFNPAGLTEPEFVELMNISAGTIDLTGVTFTAGITYTFPPGTLLSPGQRIVVTSAQFTGRLNNAGEELALTAQSGTDIFRFTFSDAPPWPGGTDGGGRAMVLINPTANPDPAIAANWRPSVDAGGQPGTDDAVPFSGSPLADTDKDGLTALLEYSLGSDDTVSGTPAITTGRDLFTTDTGTAEYLTITVPHRIGADAAAFTAEFSTGLGTWVPGLLTARRGDGSETWRAPVPVTDAPRQFLRMRAQLR